MTGRLVTTQGAPIAGATVTLTNASTGAQRITRSSAFGYYTFDGVETTEFYSLSVSHKRYEFGPDTQFFTLLDNLNVADFVSVQ